MDGRPVFTVIWCFFMVSLTLAQHTSYRKSTDQRRNLFPLSLIHWSDFHASFEEVNAELLACKRDSNELCMGGYARVVATVKKLQKSRTNPIFLNAGDNFSGSIWYTVGRWSVISYFLNLLPADVMTIGNHEFDYKVEGVIPFLDVIESPIVLANVDVSEEPQLIGKFRNSTVLTRANRTIGIIGVINYKTNEIAYTGKIKFLDESEAVRTEAAKLKAQGVDIIIVLSHAGLDRDYIIAKNGGPDIDVIVGAHTHSFLYTGSNPPGPDHPVDTYPAVITQEGGRKIPIVHSSSHTKYLGDITVYFDSEGNAVQWRGAPIFLSESMPEDEDIKSKMNAWRAEHITEYDEVLAKTDEVFSAAECIDGECAMGNFLVDVYFQYHQNNSDELNGTRPDMAFLNTGAIRATLSTGTITLKDLSTVLPFGDHVDVVDLTGAVLKQVFEYSANRTLFRNETHDTGVHVLHVSGMKVVFNKTMPANERVTSIEVFCEECEPPEYRPLEPERVYHVVTTKYLSDGGDGFYMIPNNIQNHHHGPKDITVVSNYLKSVKTIAPKKSGRTTITS